MAPSNYYVDVYITTLIKDRPTYGVYRSVREDCGELYRVILINAKHVKLQIRLRGYILQEFNIPQNIVWLLIF